MNIGICEYWALRYAVLFHDPPWKPWVVGGRKRFITKPKGGNGKKAHEEEALELVKALGLGVGGYLSDRRVKDADRIASSTDRWIINRIYDVIGESSPILNNYIANIFDPRVKFYIENIPDMYDIYSFITELKELIMETKGLPENLRYGILYTIYELLWYKNCPRCYPAADTRIPTHSVFDHLKAASTVLNWIKKNGAGETRAEGFLVHIDIPGIQSFISKARKVRDLWAGSWLVSALAWCSISEAVLKLGPSIMISPSADFNHFFIASLVNEIAKHNSNGKYDNLLNKLRKMYKEYMYFTGIPYQPIMPGTINLAIPCLDEETAEELKIPGRLKKALVECDGKKVEEYFVENFRMCWKKISGKFEDDILSIIKTIKKALEENKDQLPCEYLRWLNLYSGKSDVILEYIKKALKTPPFPIRVLAIDLGKHYGNLVDTGPFFYHQLFNILLPNELESRKLKRVKVDSSIMIEEAAYNYTQKLYNEKELPRPRHCTSCIRLPAVLHMPNEERLYNIIIEKLNGKVPRYLLSRGEALCPYCLIKRLIGEPLRFVQIANTLGILAGIDENDGIYNLVPSTVWLSQAQAFREVIKRIAKVYREEIGAGEKSYEHSSICSWLRNIFPEIGASDIDNEEKKVIEQLVSKLQKLLVDKDIGEEVVNATKDDIIKKLIEELAGISCADKKYEDLCLDLAKAFISNRYRYYSIIRGDGDFIGHYLLRGKLPLSTEDYVKEVISQLDIPEEVKDNIKKRVEEEISKELNKYKVNPDEEPKYTIIVSPAYYSALSRALMVTAILDAKIAESLGGFVVYAGGDDLAVLAPPWLVLPNYGQMQIDDLDTVKINDREVLVTPATIIWATRRNYWGSVRDRDTYGFHKLGPKGEALYPALVAYGRSYGILIAHYRDPFSAAWNVAGMLEETKDHYLVGPISDDKKKQKDVSVLYSGRISSLHPRLFNDLTIAIPNSLLEKAKSIVDIRNDSPYIINAQKLAFIVAQKICSRGLLRDIDEYRQVVKGIVNNYPDAIGYLGKILEKIMHDNCREDYEEEIQQILDLQNSTKIAICYNDLCKILAEALIDASFKLLSGKR